MTGVQTCALPISGVGRGRGAAWRVRWGATVRRDLRTGACAWRGTTARTRAWRSRAAWDRREQFMETVALSPNQALHEAVTSKGLCAISDLGDATNGGSPGDSTELLREALRSKDSGTFILSIADAQAAASAYATGVGKEVTLSLCDGKLGEYNERTSITGTIEKIAKKKIQYTHPAAGGSFDDPGESALIKITTSALTTYLVLHANPVRVIDPVIYELFDLDVREFSAVQAKSPNGFKVGFARVTSEFRLANTQGPTSADLFTLTFNKRPKPLFPLDTNQFLRQS